MINADKYGFTYFHTAHPLYPSPFYFVSASILSKLEFNFCSKVNKVRFFFFTKPSKTF